MKKILLFTVMCLFGLFSLNAQETTFFYDFNDGSLEEWNVFQGDDANGPNWAIGDGSRGGLSVESGEKKAIYSMSYDVNTGDSYIPDNYIVTKKAYTITSNSKLSWWVNLDEWLPTIELEKYSVVVSETGAEDSFEVVKTYDSGLNITETCDLSAYSGKTLYIGFHHFYNENAEAALIFDNISLTDEEAGDDNTGDDNTGDDNTGDDNTGDDNTGDDNTGDDEPETVTIPSEPTVTATATSDTSIVLVWNKVEGATYYIVNYGTETLADNLTDTTYTVNGLEPGKLHKFNVQACNEAGESAYTGGAAEATTFAATDDDNAGDGGTDDDGETVVLATPVVTAVATESTVVLTWNKVEGAESYNIFQDTVAIDTVAAPDTTYTVKDLLADSTYVFYVQAENADTVSAKSEKVSVKTLAKEESEYLIYEDFEDYLKDEYLADKGGSFWTTWNNKPATKEDAQVVELDGNKCAYMKYGVDQVLLLGGYQSGVFDLEYEVYVPEGKGAYLNVLHEFDSDNSTWAMQQYLQMTDDGTGNPKIAAGHGTVHAGGNAAADIPCVYNAWMHFRLHVNADTDLVTLYYTMPDGTEKQAHEWQWSKDSYGENIVGRKLDAMDFYPMNSKSEYYIDNISLKRIGEPTAAELTFKEESLTVGMAKDDITTVELTVENTGTSIAEYVAWVDYGVGEISNESEVVTYASEELANSTSLGWTATDNGPITFEIAAFFPAELYATSVMGTQLVQAAYFLGKFTDQDGEVVPTLEEGTGLTFRIYGQGSNGYPGKVLAEKEIPADSVVLDWNAVTFDKPVVLSGFDFYVAVEMTQCVGGASMIFDGNTTSTLQGTADLIRFGKSSFRSITTYTENNEYHGNWHLAVNCLGEAVQGGWAELNDKEIYLQIGESKTISLDVITAGLQYAQSCEADVVFSTTASEEDVRIPISLYVWGENIDEIVNDSYNIYPNPTTGMVTVEGENINYIAVYNSVGQLVKVVKTQNNIVDMSAYENGVYFFNVVNNRGENSVQRVVVAK